MAPQAGRGRDGRRRVPVPSLLPGRGAPLPGCRCSVHALVRGARRAYSGAWRRCRVVRGSAAGELCWRRARPVPGPHSVRIRSILA